MSVPRPARPRHLVATVAATLLFAACSYGAGGVSSASSGPVTPAPAASAGGGGYGGGYGGGGDDYGTNPPASPAASEGAGSNVLTIAESPTLGTFLVGQGGRTLYTFDKDTATASACSGGCAQAWPPLVVEGAEAATAGAGVSGAIATITRDDGSRQVAYDGHPLYYYAADGKAGDTNGEGVGGVWHVAKP